MRLRRLTAVAAVFASVLVPFVLPLQDSGLHEGRWKTAKPKTAYERVAPIEQLSHPEIDRRRPFFLAGPERLLLGNIEYQSGAGDQIVLYPMGAGEAAPRAVHAEPARIITADGIVHADGRARVFWLQLEHGRGTLFTAVEEGESFSKPRRLKTSSDRCFDAAVSTAANGSVWLFWQGARTLAESGRTAHHLFLAPFLDDGTLGMETLVSHERWNDWHPTLAGGSDSTLHLAYCHYTGRDYEVIYRPFHMREQSLGSPVNVSNNADADDLHPSLAVDAKGTVWFAFDRVTDPRRGISYRRLEQKAARGRETQLCIVAKTPEGLWLPPGPDGAADGVLEATTLFSWSGGFPKLCASKDGSLHLAYRILDEEGNTRPQHSYPVLLRSLEADGWTEPRLFSGSEGALEPAALAASSGRVWLACQGDERWRLTRSTLSQPLSAERQQALAARGWYLTGTLGPTRIGIGGIETRGPGGELPLSSQPQADKSRRLHPLGDPEHDPILLGDEHHQVTAGEQVYHVYWGDLHRHSSISRCLYGIEPTPFDRYSASLDVYLYDFVALTDHSGHMDEFQWWNQSKLIDLFTGNDFCPLQGFEWSTSLYGHQNVILRSRSDWIASSQHERADHPQRLWRMLPEGTALTIPHHSAHGRMDYDWHFFDEDIVRLVEVYQSARGNFEFNGAYRAARTATAEGSFVQDALQMGLTFGIVASSDHGNEASYAAVLAESLDRTAIFDALHARRTYGSTTKGPLVDFRIDDALMGSEIVADGDVRISWNVLATDEISQLVLFKNGRALWALGRDVPEDDSIGPVPLEFLYWSKSGAKSDWRFSIEVDHGEFSRMPNANDERERTAYDLKTPQKITGENIGASEVRVPIKRFMLDAPDDAVLAVMVQGIQKQVLFKNLKKAPVEVFDRELKWVLRKKEFDADPIQFDCGLGFDSHQHSLKDELNEATDVWYYLRMIQMDGEMAWSSPIRVRRP